MDAVTSAYCYTRREILLKSMALIIRSSAIHAAGCYTTSSIRSNTLVVEYTGPRISKEVADERYRNSPTTYLFGLGDGSIVIDGHGTAMFINHSCDPNCETEEKDGRVWIRAILKIAAGEELTYDYNLYDGEDGGARCNCGARKCRGTMYSADEIRRRRRVSTAARARKKAEAGKKLGRKARDSRSPTARKKTVVEPSTKPATSKLAKRPAARKKQKRAPLMSQG